MNIVIAAAIIASAAALPSALPEPGGVMAYHYSFDGHFWNGEGTALETDDTVHLRADGVDLDRTDTRSKHVLHISGALQQNGTVVTPDKNAPSDPFAPYNAIAGLMNGATSLIVGSSWPAAVPAQIGPTVSDEANVPIKATVVKVDGDTVVVSGAGSLSTISTYSDYKSPVDLTVMISAKFTSGRLERADCQAKDFVHAGPLSQTMTWRWSLTTALAPR